ncbi:uncharacterized protein LOC130700231 [Daphnia carinata]|uniref:uncharacterized protein LOC130700231 n=1 Tax=Daphnia carinata TaxID=120202 RepID=UPI00257A6308|nr:uncharacterized protein LOC130700231 [Daphnia carinata]
MIRDIVDSNWSAKMLFRKSKQRFIFFITAKIEDKYLGKKKTDLLMEKRSLTISFISSLTELRLAKMEVTYCIFSPIMLMWLLCAGIDGVESAGNVPLERAINIAGIRRPLMKNDQPNRIYLRSDQRSPSLPLRTHYYRRPPLPPHRRQQQHKQQQQPGFIRNSNGRHPPRPAPVSINNHLAFAGGNPGRGKFHHHFINQRQQPLKQHPNHQFRTVNVPTNIHYPHNKKPTNNQQLQPPNRQNLGIRQPITAPPSQNPHGTSPDELATPNKQNTMSQDAQNLLTLQLEGNDYLTYLYLAANETQLEEVYLTAATNAGDTVTHPPSDDDDIIIGAPSVHFDPYLSQNESSKPKLSGEQNTANSDDHWKLTNEGGKAAVDENVIKSLDEDWMPISSPWDIYGKKNRSSN